MKLMKRGLTVFLVVLMLLQGIPFVFATESTENQTDSETTLTAENGMGQIIENLTEEQEAEEDRYCGGYNILGMTVENNTAYVDVNVCDECTLIVAVYNENTGEMLCSATKVLAASEFNEEVKKDIVEISFENIELPTHFLAKAFIIDKNNNALCKNLVCRTYTTAYEEFMQTTPDDFADKEIVTLDTNCDDFGVLVDDVVAVEASANMTYTYNDGVYTFYNATEEVKNLKQDDIFYYELSDGIGDFLLIKVKTISVDGSTVTISEDEEIALSDAFQFIRIDEDADFSEIELTEDNLGSALSLQNPAMKVRFMSTRAEVDVSKETTFSTTLNVSYPNSETDDKEAWEKGWEIKGEFGYSLSASIKLYYDVRSGDDFYEFTTSLTHKVDFNVAFSGKIESNPKYFSIDFPTIPIGVFNLDISVYPVLSAETSMTFGGTIEIYNNVSFADGNGLTKINDTKWLGGEPTLGETEIEFKLGIGVEFDIGFKKGKKDVEGLSKLHASLSASFEGGIKANLKPSLVGVLLDKHHDCAFCLEGSISAFISGKATLKFKIISENLKWAWDAISLTGTWTVGNCYFSISNQGIKFGMGTCPYISYKVTINVTDESGTPVKNAVISTTTGYCDANGDKKFNETSMNTDENGQAVFYFKNGNHEIISKKNGIGTSGQQFEILANEKEIYLELFAAEYYNGHWYRVYQDNKTWTEAKDFCEALNGHLVTITSAEEQNFIESLIENPIRKMYWIGMTAASKKPTWITGEKYDFSNWGPHLPDNMSSTEQYVHIYAVDHIAWDELIQSRGQWNDLSNDGTGGDEADKTFYLLENIGFICEWETIPSSQQVMSYSMTLHNSAEADMPENKVTIEETSAIRNDALKDTEYVLAVIKNENVKNLLSEENLLYIDQKTAESTTVSFDFIVPEGIADYSVKIFGISHTHTPAVAVKENEIAATCTAEGSFDSVTYCLVCGDELERERITTNKLSHKDEIIPGYTATCTTSGLTDGVKCAVCDEILTVQTSLEKLTHKDSDKDYLCDYGCGYEFQTNTDTNCSHICHTTGFLGFIWQILNFFCRLFGINPVCECGIAHY